MGTARTAFARASARLGVLSGVAAVVFLLAGLGTVVADALSGAALSGLREGLDGASGTEGAARWQIRLAEDGEAQADAAASVLDRLLLPAGATWGRSLQTSPVDARAGGSEFGAVLLADDDLAEHARLVEGLWPEHPDAVAAATARGSAPATLLVGAADALGLAPGDLVTPIHGGRPLLIVGTWQPVDAADPRWFGEPILAGTVGVDAGPFVVAEPTAAGAGAPAFVRWTATLDTGKASPDGVAELQAVLPNVEPALRDQREIGASGLSALGGLQATLDRLLAGVGAVRAIAPIPVLLLAFAGIAALDRLAAILSAARRRETVLLRARGATGLRLARDTAVEVLAVGVPGAILGVAAAEASLALVGSRGDHDPVIAWIAASVAVVAAVVLVAGRSWLDARQSMLRGAGDEVGRVPRTAVASGAILVVAAAIALWQFRLYGSPLVVSASGVAEVDPVAVVAPVLALLALSIAVLALARPLGAALERVAARRSTLVPALPVRQLARRTPLYGAASLVTTLAVSGLTLTGLIAGSWHAIDRDVAALETGGDVRVGLPGRDLVRGPDPAATDERFAALDGVTADAPVFRGEVRIGSDSAQLVAGPTARLAAAAPGTGVGAADAPLADSAAAAAVALPSDADVLEVPVAVRSAAGDAGRVAISVWLLGPGGAATRVPAGEFDVASGGGTARAALPDAGPLRLLGLQASLAAAGGAEGVRVELGPLGVDGEPITAEVARTLELSSTEPEARAALTVGGGGPLPVVLAAELAERISADVGGEFAFRLVTSGTEIDAVVAGVVPVVPTAGTAALLVDLGALERATFDAGGGVPQFGERWLATTDPAGVAARLDADRRASFAVATRADASTAPFIARALAAMWAGSAGALAFALVALVALTSSLAGSRFGEVIVLRAVGVSPRIQASARFAELVVTIGAAIAAGVLVGVFAAILTAQELARAAVARSPDVLVAALALDWAPWSFGIVVFTMLAAAIALVAAHSVRRLAGRPGLREEER